MKQIRMQAPAFTMRQWLRMIAAALIISVFGWLYLFHLGSAMPLSPTEEATITNLSSFSAVIDNPLNLGYKLLTFGLWNVSSESTALRLSSVFFTACSVTLCFMLCRKWYGTAAASATTVLFACSSWMLQTGRFGAAFSSLMCVVILLITAGAWLKSNSRRTTLITYAAACLAACFIPGGLWLALVASLVLAKSLKQALLQQKKQTVPIIAGMFVAGALILGLAFMRDTSLVRVWLGLPADMPSLTTFAKQLVMSVSFLTLRGPIKPEVWLGHTPILDVASLAVAIIGAVLYGRNMRSARSLFLLAFLVPAVILIGLHGASALVFIVPVVYLIIGGGIAYLIREWRSVFPRNPIARVLAITIAVMLVGCVVRFHVTRSFVAWRQSPDTMQAYRSDTPAGRDNLLQ